jgi:hypothetical protein
MVKLWSAAALATAVALAGKMAARGISALSHPIPLAVVVLGLFGITYLGATVAMRIPEAERAFARARRLFRR